MYRVHWIVDGVEKHCDCEWVHDALNEATAALDDGYEVLVSKNGKRVYLNALFHKFWDEMTE